MAFNDPLTDRIIYCIIRVHQIRGPGFLEVIYKRALLIELARHNLKFETEKEIPIFYEGNRIGRHVIDIVVEGGITAKKETVARSVVIERASDIAVGQTGDALLLTRAEAVMTATVELAKEARMKGYEGDACGDCGNFTLVRNGTCMKCNTCGGTSGCS
jgi:GxxExxY protein